MLKIKKAICIITVSLLISVFMPSVASAFSISHEIFDDETFILANETILPADRIRVDDNATITIIGDKDTTYLDLFIVGNNATITMIDVNIDNSSSSFPIYATNDTTTFFIKGTCNFKGGINTPAIEVNSPGEVIIDGSGTLNATGGVNAAGIGGSPYSDVGTITILGGTINATGGINGAGIGAGADRSGNAINIKGGTVNATSGDGAGIGGGGDANADNIGGSSGTITISGGTVNAVSTNYGAGIGGGNQGDGDAINITGGKITAKNLFEGAGIGGGYFGSGGTINISGGIVNTESEYGASIGSGSAQDGGNINISGGRVHAKSNYYGAGIGGGSSGSAGTINISGGTVIAESRVAQDIGNGTFGAGGSFALSGDAIVVASEGDTLVPTTSTHSLVHSELQMNNTNIAKDTNVRLYHDSFYLLDTKVYGNDGMVHAYLPNNTYKFTKDSDVMETSQFTVSSAPITQTLQFTQTNPPYTKTMFVQGIVLEDGSTPKQGMEIVLRSNPRTTTSNSAGEFSFANVDMRDHNLFIIDPNTQKVLAQYAINFKPIDNFSWSETSELVDIDVPANTAGLYFTLHTSGDNVTLADVTVSFDAQSLRVVNPETGDTSISTLLASILLAILVLAASLMYVRSKKLTN